jgi:hypothetical protein
LRGSVGSRRAKDSGGFACMGVVGLTGEWLNSETILCLCKSRFTPDVSSIK